MGFLCCEILGVVDPQEVAQSAEITLNEVDIIGSSLPSPLLCEHVKKKILGVIIELIIISS
jgi:hypothetical protein